MSFYFQNESRINCNYKSRLGQCQRNLVNGRKNANLEKTTICILSVWILKSIVMWYGYRFYPMNSSPPFSAWLHGSKRVCHQEHSPHCPLSLLYLEYTLTARGCIWFAESLVERVCPFSQGQHSLCHCSWLRAFDAQAIWHHDDDDDDDMEGWWHGVLRGITVFVCFCQHKKKKSNCRYTISHIWYILLNRVT